MWAGVGVICVSRELVKGGLRFAVEETTFL